MAEPGPGSAPSAGETGQDVVQIVVRYFAAARSAAGVTDERLDIPCPPTDLPSGTTPVQCTVGQVLEVAAERHGPVLSAVLRRCSYLLDERAVHGLGTPIRDGQTLDVLPPFAGG